MTTAADVARYLLTRSQPEEGDLVSNLKLQKLVYYAQGFNLAIHGAPLFSEEIRAWEHGPVVPGVYHTYKDQGAGGIPVPMEFNPDVLPSQARELLDEVWEVYGQFSAGKLRNMTHEEPPWKETAPGAVITHDKLREYFQTQVNP